MSSQSLLLEDLRVHRAPGFPGGLEFKPAARGLVLVHGSNESGKSTLARALWALLWPDSAKDSMLDCDGVFRLGTRRLIARHRDGKTRWQESGGDSEAPNLPVAELAECYRLSIEDKGEGSKSLALQIARALAGGFDLAAARKPFEVAPRPGLSEFNELRAAREALDKVVKAERRDAEQEARLDSLRAARQAQLALIAELPMLEQLRLKIAAESTLADIEPRLKELAGCAHVRVGDLERLTRLEANQAKAKAELLERNLKLEALRAELAAASLPREGPGESSLGAARTNAIELERLFREHSSATVVATQARKKYERWGNAERADAPPLPTAEELEEFDRFTTAWNQAQAAEQLKPIERMLANGNTSDPVQSARRARPAAWVLGLAGLAAGVWGALEFHPAFWGLAVLSVAALVLEWTSRGAAAPTTDPTAAPREWLAAASAERELKREKLEQQRKEFESRWGLWPGISGIAALQMLRQRADEHGSLVEAEAALECAARAYDELSDRVTQTVQSLGVEPACTALGLRSQIEAAYESHRARQALESKLRAAEAELGRARAEQDHARSEVTELYSRARIADGDRPALERSVGQLPMHETLTAEHIKLTDRRQSAEKHLASWSGELPGSTDELSRRTEAARSAQDEADARREEIFSIEHARDARRGKDEMESARARVSEAEAALRDARERTLDAFAAASLLDDVESDMGSGTSTPVFSRAIELFSKFTAGRHRLSLEQRPGGVVEFRARDLISEEDVRLGDLSSGTRAQILLATRVAFAIEAAEKAGARPPLVLDEALATSDDGRFEAIAQSVLSLVGDGWQVVYLTSQRSDVARWTRLAGSAEQFLAIELNAAQRQARAVRSLDDLIVPMPRQVPAPGQRSAEEYGLELQVPPFDLEASVGSQHVFHLLRDDLELVHTLSLLNADRVGVAEAFAREGVRGSRRVDAPRLARLLQRIELLREFARLWSVGRGRALDREALRAAGVSDRFLAEVASLAAERGNDAAILIARLTSGELQGYGKSKTDQLSANLIESGHLDTSERAGLEFIQSRAADSALEFPLPAAGNLIQQWWHAAERSWSERRNPARTGAEV